MSHSAAEILKTMKMQIMNCILERQRIPVSKMNPTKRRKRSTLEPNRVRPPIAPMLVQRHGMLSRGFPHAANNASINVSLRQR